MLDTRISHRVFIAALPTRVFDIIADASGWDSFFTTGMELDPRPGGRMVWRWKDWGPDKYNVVAEALVVAIDRPERFAFQWYPVGKEYPTTVEFRLTPESHGTVVHLTEAGYPDTTEGRAMICECAAGWGEALTLLKFYLEHNLTYQHPNRD